jgi:hypothetical protein
VGFSFNASLGPQRRARKRGRLAEAGVHALNDTSRAPSIVRVDIDMPFARKRALDPLCFVLSVISTTRMPYPELIKALTGHRVWFWICTSPT